MTAKTPTSELQPSSRLRKIVAGGSLKALTVLGLVLVTTNAFSDEVLEQWRALKYGMFIHFGMATFTSQKNENAVSNAREPSTTYAPTNLDVDQWIRVAKDAGMKYAVLTAKHSAGHCLWDSKVQFRGKEFDFDIATSGNRTDVVAEFVKACKKYGVAPGLYWCLIDFHNNSLNPRRQWGGGKLPEDFFQLAQDQIAELIKNYPDVGYYWFDIPAAASQEQRQTIYDMVKRLRPGTLVLFNNHASTIEGAHKTHGWPTDIMNSEGGVFKEKFNPVQTWNGKTYQLGYEACLCLGWRWFWYEEDRPGPGKRLFARYRDVIEKGGNVLLDVPPDRSGRIPEYSIKALMELKQKIASSPANPGTR